MKIQNRQITENFKLFEFLYGAALPPEAKELNKKHITEEVIANIEKIAVVAQQIRNHVGKPMTITCGFRCLEWEKMRKRSGTSRHVVGDAIDFKFAAKADMDQAFEFLRDHNGGLSRYPTFIHVDLGRKRRW